MRNSIYCLIAIAFLLPGSSFAKQDGGKNSLTERLLRDQWDNTRENRESTSEFWDVV